MRTTLLDQITKRREKLQYRVTDMPLLTGINRQQYDKIEKGGNPGLATLDKIAEGLNAELMLIPKEKLADVMKILQSEIPRHDMVNRVGGETPNASDDEIADPWKKIEQLSGS